MAATEAETPSSERIPGGDSAYDGFISYSHAADDLLAPRLQAGLQRFAKPWWKRRALRLFRDEASLSANPHLWSSITSALDDSAWFVLLLSPDAAESPWVNNEVEYWLANRDADRIIPVVTGGDFTWSDGDIVSDAAPPALHGAFDEEPRWVDLRFAHTDEQLDLKNPEFSGAVADVASALRGIPKDELQSEEVKQHRRTVRTVWTAGVALIALAVAAVGFSIQATQQRDLADTQRQLAEDSAAEADSQRDIAESNAREAETQAALARSRELAASGIGVVDEDPELAILLALESLRTAPSGAGLFPEGLISLREAMDASRLVDRLQVDSGGETFVTFTPDGSSLIVSSSGESSVAMYEVVDGRISESPVWVYQEQTDDFFDRPVVRPDGEVVVVAVFDRPGDDGLPSRLVLLDGFSGAFLGHVPLGDCIQPLGFFDRHRFSADGTIYRIIAEATECADDPAWLGTLFLDASTWTELNRFDRGFVHWTDDLTRILVNRWGEPAELLSYPDLELISTHDTGVGEGGLVLSPDGSTIVVRYENRISLRVGLWDVESEQFRSYAESFEGFSVGFDFAPDGRLLIRSTETDSLIDPGTGLELLELPTAFSLDASISPDGRFAATASVSGTVELWDIGDRAGGNELPAGSDGIFWFNPDAIADGPSIAAWAFGEAQEVFWLVIFDPETGEIQNQLPNWPLTEAQLPDGRFLVVPHGRGEDATRGPLSIWDPKAGSTTPIQDCVVSEDVYNPADRNHAVGYVCPDGDLFFGSQVVASTDGSSFAAMTWDPSTAPEDPDAFRVDPIVRIWDLETLEVLRTHEVQLDIGIGNAALGPYADDWILVLDGFAGGSSGTVYKVLDVESGEWLAELSAESQWRETREISRDNSSLYLVEEGGRVWEYDTSTWQATRDWQAMQGRPRGMALSPDGTLLAVSGEDELISIWRINVEQPVLVDRIPLGAWASDITWIDDHRMGAAIVHLWGRTEWRVIELDPEAVIASARQGQVRSFTADECLTYKIDPCPTLEELKGG